ncbi:peroxisomal acyl-coenzyme A oxidase 1-like [Watersipora subatra]|uniref:peroxisomal acyl-coenzyme A oxidase 1-like n=1 Tax=Watersipora subatra TaxID=2589382 RepID=UPI00355BD5D0
MAVNKDLAKERASATFRPDAITRQLFGADGMHVRRLAYRRAAEDDELKLAEKFPTLPRDEVYTEAIRLYAVCRDRLETYGYKDQGNEVAGAEHFYKEALFIGPVHPFGVHHLMFMPLIESQGTDEQIAEFKPKAECLEIIGTYAQTEIGHGTYLKKLETTATFDKERQQFIMNSPTLSSIKFWPGALGHTSNYAAVMAKLIIDGKEYGNHAFLCQLRDLQNHQVLPGVELGDINKKFGFDMMDNGYLRFTNYRIPRNNMLMRYSQVSSDGVFSSQSIPQIAYLTMMSVRTLIVFGAADDLAMAATIATRYSAVRRQTANSKGQEPQVLDYQTQQWKLFPAISTAYAFTFTGHALYSIYKEIVSAVQAGDSSRLKELHCLTCGMKAFASETAVGLIEVCRRSCGGHGYSHASGIPKLYAQCVAQCTYEGENTVMYLQCARSLITFYMAKESGQPLPGMLKLLEESADVPMVLTSAKKFNSELYILLFKQVFLRKIHKVVGHLQHSAQATDYETAWNKHSVELVTMAKVYCQYVTVKLFADTLKLDSWDSQAREVMTHLCEFYLVSNIVQNSGQFLETRTLQIEQLKIVKERSSELLTMLRPNAVALVDAFDYPDRLLNSCLGRYDGNVYDALYDYAKQSSLNTHQVHPSHHKYVKPMQRALQCKL